MNWSEMSNNWKPHDYAKRVTAMRVGDSHEGPNLSELAPAGPSFPGQGEADFTALTWSVDSPFSSKNSRSRYDDEHVEVNEFARRTPGPDKTAGDATSYKLFGVDNRDKEFVFSGIKRQIISSPTVHESKKLISLFDDVGDGLGKGANESEHGHTRSNDNSNSSSSSSRLFPVHDLPVTEQFSQSLRWKRETESLHNSLSSRQDINSAEASSFLSLSDLQFSSISGQWHADLRDYPPLSFSADPLPMVAVDETERLIGDYELDPFSQNSNSEQDSGPGFRPKKSPEMNIQQSSLQHRQNRKQAAAGSSLSKDRFSVTTSNEFDSSRRGTGVVSLSMESLRISNDSGKALGKLDFVESPRSKAAIKEFNIKFRVFGNKLTADAEKFARAEINNMPPHSHWRVFLELAEMAKKRNDMSKARGFYLEACKAEPRASTAWLEWSKMEEESGHLRQALNTLSAGLTVCRLNDTLLPRYIKLQERMGLYAETREFLASLRSEPLERTWKALFEGAQFESRVGNIAVARELFRFLMSYVSWYGPIYYEAYRLEEREGNDDAALEIIHAGLKELPRYGPLWFGLLRVCERKDINAERRHWQCGQSPKLTHLSRESDAAIQSISKELTWRVHFERFQAQERAAENAAVGLYTQCGKLSLAACRRTMLVPLRFTLTQSMLLCPANLRWRLLLVGARLELSIGNEDAARVFLARSLQEVPSKSRASAYIEHSRLEEYFSHPDKAMEVLQSAKLELAHDWRLCLEIALVQARQSNLPEALELIRDAALRHSGTGRIWALFIQLLHHWEGHVKYICQSSAEKTQFIHQLLRDRDGELDEADHGVAAVLKRELGLKSSAKEVVFRRAVMEVPKSGEVWCERGRSLLNPFNVDDFDLANAQRALSFAILFTPQFGDTFIEYTRFELLCQVVLKYLCVEVMFIDFDSLVVSVLDTDQECDLFRMSSANTSRLKPIPKLSAAQRTTRRQMMLSILRLKYDFEKRLEPTRIVDLPELHRRCVNADPNYGLAWFHCRELPFDIPKHVLQVAHRVIRQDIESARLVYARAILLYVRKQFMNSQVLPSTLGTQVVSELVEDFSICDSMLLSTPTANHSEQLNGPILLEIENDVFSASDFATGIVELNRTMYNPHNSSDVQRKFLFGIDQIVS